MAGSHSPTITVTGDEVTAVIAGEFDMDATFTTEPALEQALEADGLQRFTLDLSEFTFIDSLGLGVVIRLAGALEARGIAMRILPGPPPVQRIFESAGLTDALPFDPEPPRSAATRLDGAPPNP
jgi:anti-anti-sigma factor